MRREAESHPGLLPVEQWGNAGAEAGGGRTFWERGGAERCERGAECCVVERAPRCPFEGWFLAPWDLPCLSVPPPLPQVPSPSS